MSNDIDWLPVLQKVFEDYGTQLRKIKVKKFAAKVARQQGRPEDKKQLQTLFKAFLKSDKGSSTVDNNDGVLSLAPRQQTDGPSQPRLSLFDLAEAAASLTTKQPGKSKAQPGKAKAGSTAQPDTVPSSSGPSSGQKKRKSRSPAAPPAKPNAAATQPSATAEDDNGNSKAQQPTPPASSTPHVAAAAVDANAKPKKKKKKDRQAEGNPAGEEAAPAAAPVPNSAVDGAPGSTEDQPVNAGLDDSTKKPKKAKKSKKKGSAEPETDGPSAAATVEPAQAQQPAAADTAAAVAAAEAAAPVTEPKKKKKRKHKDVADASPLGQATAAAAAGPDSLVLEPVVKKRKQKHSALGSPQLTPASDSQPADNHAQDAAVPVAVPEHNSAAADAAAADGNQPGDQPKRKRKSKASKRPAAGDDAEARAAEAGIDAAAEASPSEQQQLKPKKARKPRTPKAQDPNSPAAAAGVTSWREDQQRTDVKKGKFSKQEKDTLRQAAVAYAQEHNLPASDFGWLFNTKTSEHKKEAMGCWRTIAQSLPHRTYKAVYACGTRMLHEMNYQGKWSKEEDEQLRQLVGEKGSKWKEISLRLGRLPEGCRDRWRELKLGSSRKSGRWTEEETQRLRTLVNEYLARKQAIEDSRQAGSALTLTLDDLEGSPPDADTKQSDGRIILDDIDWDVISAQHGTRAAPQCLTKWYTQLAPSMVSKGEWGSGDDRRLLRALARSGAAHDFQVDWSQLVASRTAQQARRRWRLMLKCVRDAADREFQDNLHTLLETFTPDLVLHDPEAVENLF